MRPPKPADTRRPHSALGYEPPASRLDRNNLLQLNTWGLGCGRSAGGRRFLVGHPSLTHNQRTAATLLKTDIIISPLPVWLNEREHPEHRQREQVRL